jgi:hypothetical protein
MVPVQNTTEKCFSVLKNITVSLSSIFQLYFSIYNFPDRLWKRELPAQTALREET